MIVVFPSYVVVVPPDHEPPPPVVAHLTMPMNHVTPALCADGFLHVG